MMWDVDEQPAPRSAHRPSRRRQIIDAAVRQFARKGFVDASIQDVAEDADVVVTAIYYHFSGKEELFNAAVGSVFESMTEVANTARERSATDVPEKNDVIETVWEWIDEHPDETTLMYLQMPGATREITELRRGFEERHVRGASVYLRESSGRNWSPAARRGIESLIGWTLVDLLMSVNTMRLGEGPLADDDPADVLEATKRVTDRLVTI